MLLAHNQIWPVHAVGIPNTEWHPEYKGGPQPTSEIKPKAFHITKYLHLHQAPPNHRISLQDNGFQHPAPGFTTINQNPVHRLTGVPSKMAWEKLSHLFEPQFSHL
jgi:hypothetical protein